MSNIMRKNPPPKYWERKELDDRRHPQHPVIKGFVASKIEEIQKVVNISETDKLLDVGAGNGFFSYYFDRMCQTIAVDASKKMISLNPIKDKYVMDAKNLNFSDNHFDFVFESNMLHHVDNIDQVVCEMKRVSKKYLIFIEPNRANPFAFMFGLLIPAERKSIKFSLNFMKNRLLINNIKIIAAFSHGMIAPNKTPKFMLPFLTCFDRMIPLGFYNILICEK